MYKILIADACKSSLVMTSEALKDHFFGVEVAIAKTAEECVEKISEFNPDLCIVDFDLPDADGVSVIQFIKQQYQGPMFVTAYPEPEVKTLIEEELRFYRDSRQWISKPIKPESLIAQVESFVVNKERLEQRFEVSKLRAECSESKRGRKSAASIVKGDIINLSMTGGCLSLKDGEHLNESFKEQIQIELMPKGRSKKTLELTQNLTPIKATIEWSDNEGMVGLKFSKMSNVQKKHLQNILKTSEPI